MQLNNLPDNIKSNIIVDYANHWIWIGAISDEKRAHKQGVVRFEGKLRKVNRVVLHLATGFDLEGELQANHKTTCPNELCCNPDCLYAGTQQENINDREKQS